MQLFSRQDYHLMSLALKLAQKGVYRARPNPMVGCVITGSEGIIAQGYHRLCGQAHAEINALNEAGKQARGATVYVTLEPCSHTGKTPPCVNALIKAQVARVVIAVLDPNPHVSGNGVRLLEAAGIDVVVGLLADDAKQLNGDFFNRMLNHKPVVVAKVAMSLDGNIALGDGSSQWITSVVSRQDVQKLRAQSGAVLTGSGTVLMDNPKLTVREIDCQQPLRVILDSNNRLTNHANLNIFSAEAETLVLSKANTKTMPNGYLDLNDVLKKLAEKQINTVLIEAGPTLLAAFLQHKLVDELIVYMAPVLLGEGAKNMVALRINKLTEKTTLTLKDMRQIGDDIKLTFGND